MPVLQHGGIYIVGLVHEIRNSSPQAMCHVFLALTPRYVKRIQRNNKIIIRKPGTAKLFMKHTAYPYMI